LGWVLIVLDLDDGESVGVVVVEFAGLFEARGGFMGTVADGEGLGEAAGADGDGLVGVRREEFVGTCLVEFDEAWHRVNIGKWHGSP
jgi:hypothetical protein